MSAFFIYFVLALLVTGICAVVKPSFLSGMVAGEAVMALARIVQAVMS